MCFRRTLNDSCETWPRDAWTAAPCWRSRGSVTPSLETATNSRSGSLNRCRRLPRRITARTLNIYRYDNQSSSLLMWSTQSWVLYTWLILELSFSKSGGVHDRLHIYPLCGIFYFPWHRHLIERTDSFYCLLRKTLAKWGKQNCQSSEEKLHLLDSNPESPSHQSYSLTHSAIAPPNFDMSRNEASLSDMSRKGAQNCGGVFTVVLVTL